MGHQGLNIKFLGTVPKLTFQERWYKYIVNIHSALTASSTPGEMMLEMTGPLPFIERSGL